MQLYTVNMYLMRYVCTYVATYIIIHQSIRILGGGGICSWKLFFILDIQKYTYVHI